MYNISLLCPTRNRVDGLIRMWTSAIETAKDPDKLELVLYVDHDDLVTLDLLQSEQMDRVSVTVSDPNHKEIYSNLHNICCQKANADIVFSCADDLVFRSRYWDKIVLDKFSGIEDKIAFLFPDDGHWGSKFGTHGFFHKKWFSTLGYISPPLFTVDYSDNYINDIAKAIDRSFYLDNIFIEHMHWTFGKMEMDSTAKEAHQRRSQTNNALVYQNFDTMQKQREDIQKLLSTIKDIK